MIEYNYRALERLRNSRAGKLFTSYKYLGTNLSKPTIIADIENLYTNNLIKDLNIQEKKTLRAELTRINRLQSKYFRVQEKELARIASEQFIYELDRLGPLNKTQQNNIQAIKRLLEKADIEQKIKFLEEGYQDPRTILARSVDDVESPTPEQKLSKALGRNGYLVRRVKDALAK